ncbi:MAG: TrkA C-terminal domain-containing protein, partial [Solirubrobacteraceae bacterium]
SNLQALARPTGTALVEQRVATSSAVCGRAVGQVAWPSGTLILALGREGELIFPDRATVLEPGDLVSALVSPDAAARLEQMLSPGTEPEGGEPMALI